MRVRGGLRDDRKPWHTEEYVAYLASEEWALVRAEALERAGLRCEHGSRDRSATWCEETTGLEVHHVHYGRLGNEEPNDLRVLCREHHRLADMGRRDSNKRQAFKSKYGYWPRW